MRSTAKIFCCFKHLVVVSDTMLIETEMTGVSKQPYIFCSEGITEQVAIESLIKVISHQSFQYIHSEHSSL